MRRDFLLAASMFAAAVPSVPAWAQARLTDQEVRGADRICQYERDLRRPSQSRRTVTVGRGEPCPFYYSRVASEARAASDAGTAREADIPIMAVLATEVRGPTGVTCVYRYAGQEYYRNAGAAGTCPYSPRFR